MSEDKKSLIDLVPDSVDNAVKNITDKPTQNMGTTLADIWYLVFGGVSHAAEKRKLKYSYALQEFENELKEKLSKIPQNNIIEPDMQILGQLLEASKYCIEKEELRHMFSSLIAASFKQNYFIPPVLVNIIKYLSPIDVKILKYLYIKNKNDLEISLNELIDSLEIDSEDYSQKIGILYTGLLELEQMQLIYNESEPKQDQFMYQNIKSKHTSLNSIKLAALAHILCHLCLDENNQ